MKYINNTILVDEIKALIKSKGIKQQYIADCLNMSKQQFSQLLSGRKQLNFADINKILNCIDYEIDFKFVAKTIDKEWTIWYYQGAIVVKVIRLLLQC